MSALQMVTIFAIFNAGLYATLLLVIVLKHISENGITVRWRSRRLLSLTRSWPSLLLLPVSAGAAIRGPYSLEAMAWGSGPIAKTAEYKVAGAGQGGTGVRVVKWRLKWLGESGTSTG